MVLLSVKKGEELLFLYETSVNELIGNILKELVDLQNLRLRVGRLADGIIKLMKAADDLASYGVYKPENQHGYTEEQIENIGKELPEESLVLINGVQYIVRPDPTGRRVGHAPTEQVSQVIKKAAENARQLVSKEVALLNKTIDPKAVEEAISEIKGAVTIAFPMGIPDFDPVQIILDDDEDLSGTSASKEVLDSENTCLWWASKQLSPEKKLMDFVGRNEKTKIIVKFAKKGQGAPVKEAPLTEEAQRNLMAYYYKKQEQLKKLEENQDDEYLQSSWANNSSLKSSFNGIGSISWKPK